MAAVIAHPDAWWYYALMTMFGSIAGCYALYLVGRRGGEAFLRKRFSAGAFDRGLAMYQRWGLLAVIVPSLLPPPTPFKIFVLSAGTFGISWPKFLTAVIIGRGIRYFSEGILAVTYGPAAIEFVQRNYGKIGLAFAVVIVVAAIIFFSVGRRRVPSIEA